MNRSEFIAATAIILFGAFLLGWFACWLVHRLTRPGREDIAQHGRIAHALHEAEAARDAARETLDEREAVFAERQAGAAAELRAATEGLREARAEIEELRDFIEQRLARR
jgi:prophage endopeptidase